MFSPKTVLLCSLMWTFWSLAACTSGNAASSITDFVPWNDPKYPLIDWVRSKHGGYVSDKIEIRSRPLSPKDDNSPIDFGWFATDDVAEGEVLMIIPPDAYIDTDAKYNQKTYDDDDVDDPLCTDIVKLVQEYKKGEESDYYVLASFILDEDSPGSMRNRQPAFWSQEARHILWRTMLDEFLHPDEGESNLSFADDCGFSVDLTRADSRERQLYESAFRYFISKANGNILFSLHDLIHHRNGKWRNVDLKRERNGRIVLKAFQEIPKDGQLYKSFNRCDFADGNCDNWDENFVATQDVLRGTGMLEDYPRRWIIVAQPGSEEYTSVFDIDKTKDGRFHVTWKTGTPNIFVLNFMEAYRKSFDAKEAKIKEQVANLESNFERDTILRFLTAYKEALYLGWIHRNGDQSTTDVELDPFEEPKGLGIQVDDYFMCYIDRDCAGRDFDNTYMNSHYQSMKWKHCPEEDNSCLTLDSIIQSCTSFRPHYHESFVHIPAQYAKEMKRVAFLGGGDNLLLYEIMKYPQLEKVVGLELDQTVVRYAFKHFGASPFFHDPRIEWWFGDASKSFLALPKEYYGSFDLVIVDLLSFIADTLKVTDDLTLMNAAGLLMKQDGGIIVKQEDFAIKMIEDQFAKYTTKMLFYDLPFLCEQTITMGSNSVDFFAAKRYDHGIKTFVRDDYLVHGDGGESKLPFPAWKEYYRVPDDTCQLQESRTLEESSRSSTSTRFGVLLIIEAENLTLLESIDDYQDTIKSLLSQLGLTSVDSSHKTADAQDQHFLLLFKEGYVIVRPSQESKYIGFDVMLWDELQKLEEIKEALVAAFGGNSEASTSSFRIVAGGMSGATQGVCQKEQLSDIAVEHESHLCESHGSTEANTYDSGVSTTIVRKLIASMIPKSEDSLRALLILCGEEDVPCMSLDAAKGEYQTLLVPVYSCSPSLSSVACRDFVRNRIQDGVNNNKKLDGILVDTAASKETCQILHSLLSQSEMYDSLLEENYMAVTPVPSVESWRTKFLDRFRTELGAFFAPAHRADFRFSKEGQETHWRLFVTGLDDFFLRLSKLLSSISGEIKWEHTLDVVENGEKRFVVDFEPSRTLRDKNYNKTSAKKQWNSQHPIGYQVVVQMERIPSIKPFEIQERVLVNTVYDGPWDKMYEPARIKKMSERGDKVTVEFEVNLPRTENDQTVTSDRILRAFSGNTSPSASFEVGDTVLYDTGIEGKYFATMVSAKHQNGNYYDLAKLSIDGKKFYNVSKSQLISDSESPEFFIEPSPLTSDELLGAFKAAIQQLKRSLTADELHDVSPKSFVTGNGIVATAFWSSGNAVMKWNGESRIELNLYLEEEGKVDVKRFRGRFARLVGSLATVMVDEFPRGYGQVVNFASQMTEPPHWITKSPSRRKL